LSPPKKHVEEGAKNTTVSLTAADYEAIHEISKVRRASNDSRTRLNDILVDALWDFLKQKTGKTRDDITALLPFVSPSKPQNNITQMPTTTKRKH
jgi:hypothetical protein